MAFEHFLCFLSGDFDLKFCSKLRRRDILSKFYYFPFPRVRNLAKILQTKKKFTCHTFARTQHPPPPTPPLVRPNIYTCIRRQELKGLRSEGVIALYPLRFSPSPLSQKRLILSRRLAITQTV